VVGKFREKILFSNGKNVCGKNAVITEWVSGVLTADFPINYKLLPSAARSQVSFDASGGVG